MDTLLAYVALCTLFAKQFIPLHRKQDLKNSLPECPELYHKYLYTHKISTQALKQGVQLDLMEMVVFYIWSIQHLTHWAWDSDLWSLHINTIAVVISKLQSTGPGPVSWGYRHVYHLLQQTHIILKIQYSAVILTVPTCSLLQMLMNGHGRVGTSINCPLHKGNI